MSNNLTDRPSEYRLIGETAVRLWAEVDVLLEDSRVKKRYIPENYAHVNGVAALGHLCHMTEDLTDIAERSDDTLLTVLIIRN